MMPLTLSKLEEDFLGDLMQGSHELWELFAFVRHHYPNAPDSEIIQRGSDLLSAWINRGWLRVDKSRNDNSLISGEEFLLNVNKLGSDAADPRKGNILLSLTERASSDVTWLVQ